MVHDTGRQPLDLPVLKGNDSVIRYQENAVIGYGFFPGIRADRQIIGLKADGSTNRTGTVPGRSTVGIPDLDFRRIMAAVVPELLEESVTGEHGSG